MKNPLANTRDMGSIPGPGRFHLLQSNQALELQPLKPVCLEPVLRKKRGHSGEEPAIAVKRAPCPPQLEKARPRISIKRKKGQVAAHMSRFI